MNSITVDVPSVRMNNQVPGEAMNYPLLFVLTIAVLGLAFWMGLKVAGNPRKGSPDGISPNSDPESKRPSQVGIEGFAPKVNLSRGFGGFDISAVGESHYQDNLRDAMGCRFRNPDDLIKFDILLIPEPENLYDRNAVALYSGSLQKLGYLSRENAAKYKQVFRKLKEMGRTGTAKAAIVGGTKTKPSIGLIVDLLGPREIIDRINLRS